MSHWDAVRTKAREWHDAALAATEGNPSASALLQAAGRISGLTCEPLSAGDSLLGGAEAVLDREADTVWYNREVEPWRVLLIQAHEYAHFWLGDNHGACSATDIDADLIDGDTSSGAARVEGYGPHERREREANVFAVEFLLSTAALRTWYMSEGLDAQGIAASVGLPDWVVVPQLSRALLLPCQSTDQPVDKSAEGVAPTLDASQAEAAFAPCGPLLLEAGPGTGKTRTLVGRLAHLMQQGVPPASILALTFSNKAAEEMRQRVARVAPEAALGMWTGTFHAFGLDLLRKFGTWIGLPTDPTVLDPIDALFVLEDALPELELVHYKNLYEPTMHLGELLAAISRAKDELVGPGDYMALAQHMRDEASGGEAVEAAEKALEVAHVYAVYQAYLEREGLLDFGDLIFRSVALLRTHPDVRIQIQATYRHVLVDEYQDVNRASGLLLREIAGDGTGLWVVGDVRQAIYRFRGAAPRNMRLFAQDFPGAKVRSLRRNYRSQPVIRDVVAELAPRMLATAGDPFTPWEADRPATDGKVLLEVAEHEEAEGVGLAREIGRQRTAGIPYREQAVLCRSHTGLARVATALERAGIPTLYLGNLFEREEIRDLLSLLSLTCEGNGSGLIRVARFPEYAIPSADVRALRSFAREQAIPFPRVLAVSADAQGLSDQGRQGLLLLARHLDGICYGTSVSRTLGTFLFSHSSYLHPVLADTSVVGDQRRMAIYQFLEFAREWRPRERDAQLEPKRAFLRYVRQLRSFGEDRSLRQLPEWAEGLDAVRMLTVHASKGLEFSAVYLPRLGLGSFPARHQAETCPPPVGMLTDSGDAGAEEEECLFFVALSRARDVLCLSRAQRYGKQNSTASPLLWHIAAVLPQPPATTWVGGAVADNSDEPTTRRSNSVKPLFTADMLDVYITCPRQFFYEFELGLSGRRDDTAYVQFHRCVYAVLRWLQEERVAGREKDIPVALARLADEWQAHGPTDHAYAAVYRRDAERMVTKAVERRARGFGRPVHRDMTVELEHGRVTFRPDLMEVKDEDGKQSVLVQRLRTGRASKSEGEKDIYAVYQQAGAEAFPSATIKVQTLYLSTEQTQDVRLAERSVKTRLSHYDAAIVGIQEGRFPSHPDERRCPRCAHYFICPTGDEPA